RRPGLKREIAFEVSSYLGTGFWFFLLGQTGLQASLRTFGLIFLLFVPVVVINAADLLIPLGIKENFPNGFRKSADYFRNGESRRGFKKRKEVKQSVGLQLCGGENGSLNVFPAIMFTSGSRRIPKGF